MASIFNGIAAAAAEGPIQGSLACILFSIGERSGFPILRVANSPSALQTAQESLHTHSSTWTPLTHTVPASRLAGLDLSVVLEASLNISQPAIDQEQIDLSLASGEISISSSRRAFRPECRFRSFPSTQHTTHNTALPRWQIDLLEKQSQRPARIHQNSTMAYSWNAAPHLSPIGLRRVLPGHHARGSHAT
jgi:hypothetical protein